MNKYHVHLLLVCLFCITSTHETLPRDVLPDVISYSSRPIYIRPKCHLTLREFYKKPIIVKKQLDIYLKIYTFANECFNRITVFWLFDQQSLLSASIFSSRYWRVPLTELSLLKNIWKLPVHVLTMKQKIWHNLKRS